MVVGWPIGTWTAVAQLCAAAGPAVTTIARPATRLILRAVDSATRCELAHRSTLSPPRVTPDRPGSPLLDTLGPVRLRIFAPGVLALVVSLTACGGGSSKSNSSPTVPQDGSVTTTVPSGSGTTVHVANKASDEPSESAKMICDEAVKDINEVIGIDAKVSTPTWDAKEHIYACDYNYPNNATMHMAVKEMSSTEETTAYYNSVAKQMGNKQNLEGLGQGAFATTDGSVIVRKDFKVLTVGVAKLPAQFGDPPDTKANDAINVAYTIMGCWTGA